MFCLFQVLIQYFVILSPIKKVLFELIQLHEGWIVIANVEPYLDTESDSKERCIYFFNSENWINSVQIATKQSGNTHLQRGAIF